MKFTSYSLETAPASSVERSKTSVEGRTEVAVIGGGLTGVAAALHLARRGAKVDLFEQNTVGFGPPVAYAAGIRRQTDGPR